MESLDPGASSTGRQLSAPAGQSFVRGYYSGMGLVADYGSDSDDGSDDAPDAGGKVRVASENLTRGWRSPRTSSFRAPSTSHVTAPCVTCLPVRRSTTRTERRELLTSPPPPPLATTDPRAGRAPFDGGRQGGASHQPGSEAQPRAGDAGGGAAVLRVRRRWVACTREENTIFLRLSSTASPSALTPSFLPLSPVRPPRPRLAGWYDKAGNYCWVTADGSLHKLKPGAT